MTNNRSIEGAATPLTTTTAMPPITPNTFHLFPKFPMEIREEIWRSAARISRDISIFVISVGMVELPDSQSKELFVFRSSTPFPAMYQATKESRKVAETSYKWGFMLGDANFKFEHGITAVNIMYNPRFDRICFLQVNRTTAKLARHAIYKEGIRRIAVPITTYDFLSQEDNRKPLICILEEWNCAGVDDIAAYEHHCGLDYMKLGNTIALKEPLKERASGGMQGLMRQFNRAKQRLEKNLNLVKEPLGAFVGEYRDFMQREFALDHLIDDGTGTRARSKNIYFMELEIKF